MVIFVKKDQMALLSMMGLILTIMNLEYQKQKKEFLTDYRFQKK